MQGYEASTVDSLQPRGVAFRFPFLYSSNISPLPVDRIRALSEIPEYIYPRVPRGNPAHPLQGYLAHRKTPTPQDHHRALGIGLR